MQLKPPDLQVSDSLRYLYVAIWPKTTISGWATTDANLRYAEKRCRLRELAASCQRTSCVSTCFLEPQKWHYAKGTQAMWKRNISAFAKHPSWNINQTNPAYSIRISYQNISEHIPVWFSCMIKHVLQNACIERHHTHTLATPQQSSRSPWRSPRPWPWPWPSSLSSPPPPPSSSTTSSSPSSSSSSSISIENNYEYPLVN